MALLAGAMPKAWAFIAPNNILIINKAYAHTENDCCFNPLLIYLLFTPV